MRAWIEPNVLTVEKDGISEEAFQVIESICIERYGGEVSVYRREDGVLSAHIARSEAEKCGISPREQLGGLQRLVSGAISEANAKIELAAQRENYPGVGEITPYGDPPKEKARRRRQTKPQWLRTASKT